MGAARGSRTEMLAGLFRIRYRANHLRKLYGLTGSLFSLIPSLGNSTWRDPFFRGTIRGWFTPRRDDTLAQRCSLNDPQSIPFNTIPTRNITIFTDWCKILVSYFIFYYFDDAYVYNVQCLFDQIHTHLVNGRPGAANHTQALQEFTRARYVKLRLQGLHRASGAIADQRRAFYSIKEISIGGRCICSGHASRCRYSPRHGVSFMCLFYLKIQQHISTLLYSISIQFSSFSPLRTSFPWLERYQNARVFWEWWTK